MRYVSLGRTGLRVSNLCLGSDNFGNPYGADRAVSRRIIGQALDAGINFIDTADSYSGGQSEVIIGRYLQSSGRRNSVVLTTKFRSRTGPGPNDAGGSRYHIMQAVEASLRRLRTDHIDLYLIHHWDPATPIEETLRTLDDIVRVGKVRYIGCSNLPAWVLMKALWTSDVRSLARFDCIQSAFNIVQPGLAREVIPMCVDEGVAVTTYSVLASGFLTGKHPRSGPLDDSKLGDRDRSRGGSLVRRYWDDRKLDVVDRLKDISSRSGEPIERLAMQWVRETPGVTAPIFGARTEQQLQRTFAAWEGEAPSDVMDEVRAVADEYVATAPMSYPPAAPVA